MCIYDTKNVCLSAIKHMYVPIIDAKPLKGRRGREPCLEPLDCVLTYTNIYKLTEFSLKMREKSRHLRLVWTTLMSVRRYEFKSACTRERGVAQFICNPIFHPNDQGLIIVLPHSLLVQVIILRVLVLSSCMCDFHSMCV